MVDQTPSPDDPSAGEQDVLQFRTKQTSLAAVQVWEYDAASKQTSHDIAQETIRMLAAPDDFPPIEAAIVSGDRVALAVDPNIPSVDRVIEGTMRLLRATPAAQVDIVVWDEATEETMQRIRGVAGGSQVIEHRSADRESLCYLAADQDALPIYLNRVLVDADFVLPIVAVRPSNVSRRRDLTGIFPTLSDSATRVRYREYGDTPSPSDTITPAGHTIAQEVPWLLGVQVIVAVTVNSRGEVGHINAGTVEAISKRITPTLRHPDPVPPPADLVVASLDGDRQQQTWENVVRAADAALAYAQPDATIVIWSTLDEIPQGALTAIDSDFQDETDHSDQPTATSDEGGDLPDWDRFNELASRLKEIMKKHRLMLHSHLAPDVVEPMGFGTVQSAGELANLSRGFESCGVLRAASFAGGN